MELASRVWCSSKYRLLFRQAFIWDMFASAS
ncbi:hypothetical protein O9929_03850 [Vibrio lentus]|nr:hypothetical protein [Vibrio lentus]